MRGIRLEVQQDAEELLEERYWTELVSSSPQTTRGACSRRPWKQRGWTQKPLTALPNAAHYPSAPWAQQYRRNTARPGVTTADSPSAACAPQGTRVPCSASTRTGGTPRGHTKQHKDYSSPAGCTPKPSKSDRPRAKAEPKLDEVSGNAGGKRKRSRSATRVADVKTEAHTSSATSASAPPAWILTQREEALRAQLLNAFANRKGGDESPAKMPKSAAQEVKSNPHPAHMEEATADKVQEEVKEKTDSEDSPPDVEDDWLAKGPRGDFAHGCPSEL